MWHAVLDTWPGLVWLTRQGVLIVLGPLAPGALRDYRGQRMVLLVL